MLLDHANGYLLSFMRMRIQGAVVLRVTGTVEGHPFDVWGAVRVNGPYP
jgi:hypothetical protein